MWATSGRSGREMIAAIFLEDACGLAMSMTKERLYRISANYPQRMRERKSLEDAVQQELTIPFHTKDWRLNRLGPDRAKIPQRGTHLLYS